VRTPGIKSRWLCRVGRLLLPVLLVLSSGPLDAEVFYQWKDVYIGALDPDAWAGLVFAPSPRNVFAFRLRLVKGSEAAEGIDHLYLVSEVGPHAPDGTYARLKLDAGLPFGKGPETPVLRKPSRRSNTLHLEWSRRQERLVIGRITVPEGLDLQIVHYFPWNFSGRYRLLSEGHIRGESISPERRYYLFWTNQRGVTVGSPTGDELIVSFPAGKRRSLYFVAGTGEDLRILRNSFYRFKNEKIIDTFLQEESRRYERKRVSVEGLYGGVEKAVTNNLFWTTLYQTGYHRFYIPAGRRWIFPAPGGKEDHWTIFEWDAFFNALLVSTESTKHAKDMLRAVLETQYPNGNIPNWRGRFGGTPDRSQPPIGSYVVLKCFQRDGDLAFLRYAYPYLRRWHAFWKSPGSGGRPRRDGNEDGLLEWGSDPDLVADDPPSWEEDASGETRASWESGQDDLPNWDQATYDPTTGTLTMNCVDLNALYTLDSWCLAQIARILRNEQEYSAYMAEYQRMKALVNLYLWDETEGFYLDRHWDGRFSRRKAASNFYPLIAGIPDREKALRLRQHLMDEEEFWGEFVIPTISRDDPAFADQQYWRGTIWPPINYLVYQGLKAYGFDAVAAEFARKSVDIFMRSWENFQLCPENFDSRTGEAGGRRFQSWGPLFALIGLEEYLDFSPWEGFRFGMLNPERKGRLSRILVQGRHYEVEVSPSRVRLKEEGKEILEADQAAVFRRFLYSEREVSFEVKTLRETRIKLKFLTAGKFQVEVDDRPAEIFKGRSRKIRVPEGKHKVTVLLLEKKD